MGHYFYNSMARNCIVEAYRLQLSNEGRGKVYYVVNDEVVGHAYYVPDSTRLDDPALNQADNGFTQFPCLTVREVLENHNSEYLLVTAD